MFCGKCGKKLPDDAKFCTSCGAKVAPLIRNEDKTAEDQAKAKAEEEARKAEEARLKAEAEAKAKAEEETRKAEEARLKAEEEAKAKAEEEARIKAEAEAKAKAEELAAAADKAEAVKEELKTEIEEKAEEVTEKAEEVIEKAKETEAVTGVYRPAEKIVNAPIPPVKKSGKGKKVGIALLVVLLIAAIGGAVLFFADPFGWRSDDDDEDKIEKVEKDDTDDVKDDEEPTAAPTELPEETPSPVPTEEPSPTPGEPSPTPAGNSFVYERGISVLTLDEGDDFDSFINELFVKMVASDSVSLHFKIEDPASYDIILDPTLGDPNEEEADSYSEEIMEFVREKLDEFDVDELGDKQRIVYKLLSYELDMYDQGKKYEDDYIAGYFSQNGGYISNLQTSYTEFSIQTKEDAESFLTLLLLLPDYLKSIEKLARNAVVDDDLLFTQAMYDASLEYGEAWLADDIEDEVIYVAYKENLNESDLDESEKAEYLERAKDIINDEIVPAINSYIDFVESLEGCIDEPKGLAKSKGGKDYYAYLFESYIGTGTDIDDVLSYVYLEYYDYFDTIIDKLLGDITLQTQYFTAESKYGDDPDEILAALSQLAKENFPDIGEVDWIISYLSEDQEVSSTTAYYLSPQLDNIGRKVMRVNKSNISDSIELFTTLAHEGIPGHLYQDQYIFDYDDYEEIHAVLTYLATQEGWAMYVEKLAMNWCLDNEELAEVKYKDMMLNYILMSIADIEVNYNGWSMDDLYEFLDEEGLGDEETADYIYNIVVSDPGLYPAYGIGFLLMDATIDELVDSGMSLKEAHKAVLEIGNAPFSILWDELGIKNPITGK